MKIKPRFKIEIKKFLIRKLKEESNKAIIISSHKLSQEQIAELKIRFPSIKDKKIQLDVNNDLLAGFIIKEGSKVTDFSFKSKLAQFKKTINEIT